MLSTSSKTIVRVGVQPIVTKNGKILLGQRKNVFHSGSWGLPGGHLEPGETLLEAAARELFEETGLKAIKVRLFCITDPTAESNYHMQIGVEVLEYEGSPVIIEPENCSALDFFSISELPQPIFIGSVDVLKNYSDKILYRSEFIPEQFYSKKS